jgi:hypothetical protein
MLIEGDVREITKSGDELVVTITSNVQECVGPPASVVPVNDIS